MKKGHAPSEVPLFLQNSRISRVTCSNFILDLSAAASVTIATQFLGGQTTAYVEFTGRSTR